MRKFQTLLFAAAVGGTLTVAAQHDTAGGYQELNDGAMPDAAAWNAVPEGLRGRGYGSEALGLVRAMKPDRRLLIDIERPGEGFANNAQRLRRVPARGGRRAKNVEKTRLMPNFYFCAVVFRPCVGYNRTN